MLPAAIDTRVNPKHPRPNCPIKGWAAAWSHLERIDNGTQRDTLAYLVRTAGFQGAPALGHLAALLRYWTGQRKEYPTVPKALKGRDLALVEKRATDLLRPYVGTTLFPDMRKLT